MVGYTAGEKLHPTYQQVCSGSSGHTEGVQMIFNPAVGSYKELLMVLFDRMDPTTLNRQGNDRGTQYRRALPWTSSRRSSPSMLTRLWWRLSRQKSSGQLRIITRSIWREGRRRLPRDVWSLSSATDRNSDFLCSFQLGQDCSDFAKTNNILKIYNLHF